MKPTLSFSKTPADRLPRVAVIIVNFNGGEILQKCLLLLRQQTYPSFRVIVVDNDSRDNSVETAERTFPEFSFIRAGYNSGFATGNNLGFAAAQDCEWIACLNPDAFAAPDWLSNLVKASMAHPEFQFFGSLMQTGENSTLLDGTGDVYHVSGAVWRKNFRARRSQAGRELMEIFGPCAAASFYRRDILAEVNGFDENYFCYFEDVDLAFRLRLLGYRCAYVPDAIVDHIGSAITGYKSDFAIYHGHRNLEWTFFKNMPPLLLWFYLPQHLLLVLVTLIAYSLYGKGRVIFKAKRDALLGLPAILRQRTHLQHDRKVSSSSLRAVMAHGLFLPYRRHFG